MNKRLLAVIFLTTILVLSICACGKTPSITPTIQPTTATPPTTILTAVTFPDANLETAIREAIYKLEGPIYTPDLMSLTYLRPFNISDLTGLEYCLNLRKLNLESNNISDISALAGLSNLEWLSLWDNNISDISALIENAGFSDGDSVYLMDNPLSAESTNSYIPQ
ncbi:MAG: leucine-rich repeat domain-containing protein, partial [Dehalococcoidales bacterium]|nr:leucine-rich repeat domain-containing protein [Dehalococcoidales bacterium]